MKYLIVGLGNIGPEYHETRHNIGFMVVDALAKAAGATFEDRRYGFITTLSVKGRQLLLLKPSTYMNLSGNAVRYWMQKENIPLENVLIVVDDLALPFGTQRSETHSCYFRYTKLRPTEIWHWKRLSTRRTNRLCVRPLHRRRLEDHARTAGNCRRNRKKFLPGRNRHYNESI